MGCSLFAGLLLLCFTTSELQEPGDPDTQLVDLGRAVVHFLIYAVALSVAHSCLFIMHRGFTNHSCFESGLLFLDIL